VLSLPLLPPLLRVPLAPALSLAVRTWDRQSARGRGGREGGGGGGASSFCASADLSVAACVQGTLEINKDKFEKGDKLRVVWEDGSSYEGCMSSVSHSELRIQAPTPRERPVRALFTHIAHSCSHSS